MSSAPRASNAWRRRSRELGVERLGDVDALDDRPEHGREVPDLQLGHVVAPPDSAGGARCVCHLLHRGLRSEGRTSHKARSLVPGRTGVRAARLTLTAGTGPRTRTGRRQGGHDSCSTGGSRPTATSTSRRPSGSTTCPTSTRSAARGSSRRRAPRGTRGSWRARSDPRPWASARCTPGRRSASTGRRSSTASSRSATAACATRTSSPAPTTPPRVSRR